MATAIVAEMTSCGKSSLIFRLLKNREMMFDTSFYELINAIPSNQEIYVPDFIKHDKRIRFHKGIPDVVDLTDGQPRLLILDDLADNVDANVQGVFTKYSHHLNISVIQLAQNVFTSNKIFRTISLNSQYMIIFMNPRGVDQVGCLGRQLMPHDTKFFM